jgi:hypothetical protein
MLMTEWKQVPAAMFQHLVENLPRKVEAVIIHTQDIWVCTCRLSIAIKKNYAQYSNWIHWDIKWFMMWCGSVGRASVVGSIPTEVQYENVCTHYCKLLWISLKWKGINRPFQFEKLVGFAKYFKKLQNTSSMYFQILWYRSLITNGKHFLQK